MTESQLQEEIDGLQVEIDRIAWNESRTMEDMRRFRNLGNRLLWLERHLYRKKLEPVAMRIPWPMPWRGGANFPHVMSNGLSTVLAYRMGDAPKEWPIQPSDFKLLSPLDDAPCKTALVNFEFCCGVNFQSASYDSYTNHPLYGRGLDSSGVHRILNSSWTKKLSLDTGITRSLRHYIFVFHDDIFECAARSISLSAHLGPFMRGIDEAVRLLIRREL